MKTKMIIKTENGATVVEFAIVLPLLILLIFGIIEIGLLLYTKQVMTNAVREGVRAGVVVRTPRLTDAQIEAVIDSYADNYLITFGSENFPSPVISPDGPRSGDLYGTDLSVEITYDYDFLVLSNIGLGPITLKAESIMKME